MTPPSRTDINCVGNVFVELSPNLEPLRIVRIENAMSSMPFHRFSYILLDRIKEEDECTSYMLIPHPEKEGIFTFDVPRKIIAPYKNLFVQADDALWYKALRIMGLIKTVFVNRFARLQSEYIKQDLIAVSQQLSAGTAFPALPLPFGYYLVKGPSSELLVCKLFRECGYGLYSGETTDGIDADGGKRMFFSKRYKVRLPQIEGLYIDLPPQGIGSINVNSCVFYFHIPQSAYDDIGSLLSSYRDAQLRLLKPYLADIGPVSSNYKPFNHYDTR